MHINSENSLFKSIDVRQIPNIIERKVLTTMSLLYN
jgi:hypothetical protein